MTGTETSEVMVSTDNDDRQLAFHTFDLCCRLWREAEQDRRKIKRLGHAELGAVGLDLGLLIEVEERFDVLAGVLTTLRKTGVFPEEHRTAINNVTFLDDDAIRNWAARHGGELPRYLNYLICLQSLCLQLQRIQCGRKTG